MRKETKNELLDLLREIKAFNNRQMMLESKTEALFEKMQDEECFELDIYNLVDSLDILLHSNIDVFAKQIILMSKEIEKEL